MKNPYLFADWIYHLIEYSQSNDMYYKDPAWLAFNDSTFKYGNGGRDAYKDPTYANTEHPRVGFVTGYATSALEEDKAETYAFLFVKEGYASLQKWEPEDQILTKKVNYLKKFILSRVPEMNDAYFQKINN